MSARTRIGKALRRWADRIDGSDMVPTIIKVPSGTLDRIRQNPAKPSPEFHAAIDHAIARRYYETHSVEKEIAEATPANPVVSPFSGFGIHAPREVLDQARAIAKARDVSTGTWLREVVEKAVAEYADPVLEERIPADLNPWAGAAVLGLHNHTAEEACDDTCTTYGEGPTI